MKPVRAGVVVAGLVAATLTTFTPAAHAVTCEAALKFTHIQFPSSQLFRATDLCDGVYAFGVERETDDIRGRFYKDGSWQLSSYGWVRIRKDQSGLDKVVGNTIDGREIKGQGRNVVQQVGYAF